MQRLLVEGGRPLQGTVSVSGAKNAVLKLMAAALLGDGKFIIRNVPAIKDVFTMIGVLKALGVKCQLEGSTLYLTVGDIQGEAPAELVQEMRASIQIMGPLIAKLGWVKISQPGGCPIGDRPIDLHVKNLEKLGAIFEEGYGYISAKAKRLVGTELCLDFPSVGTTENIMMAATLAVGTTIIHNAAREPEIIDAQNFLNRMGARVFGAGTGTITIKGVKALSSTDYTVIPDRIEAGSYLVAAAITGGKLRIQNIIPKHLTALIGKLQEANVKLDIASDQIIVQGQDTIYPANILTLPYPGFATDLQPQFMALATLANGTSVVKETVYSNRFGHAHELRRMGAEIIVDGNAAVIKGVKQLAGAHLYATDLRAGAALVLAGLSATGITSITGVEHIERGYENLVEKLQLVGGKIWREDEV